ncbi:hypothetical protein FGADI_4980 [Fusarium gaditjirri]|uniref:RING-type domain-containing protein n=1 Tax=Fusarium gaditjirri TaxID=282569 RepID=A0A8H4TBK1_9HYPO|nr:hypothetical protein FGADI_4980 [Fusarium gaditjirri]
MGSCFLEAGTGSEVTAFCGSNYFPFFNSNTALPLSQLQLTVVHSPITHSSDIDATSGYIVFFSLYQANATTPSSPSKQDAHHFPPTRRFHRPREDHGTGEGVILAPLASQLTKDNVKFRDLAPECSICLEDITALPYEHAVQNEHGETHRGVIFACGHIFGQSCVGDNARHRGNAKAVCPTCRAELVHPMCVHSFYGMFMPSNKPDMDLIPPTINNGGAIAEYCEECSVIKTVEDLNQVLHHLLPEDLKGRYTVSMVHDGETVPLPWMRNCPEMRAPAAFRTFVAQYLRRLDQYQNSPKLWNNDYHAGDSVKVRDLGSKQ